MLYVVVQKYYKFVVEDIKIPLKSILKLFNVSLACSNINLGTNLKKKDDVLYAAI